MIETVYEHPSFALTSDDPRRCNPYIQVVTPFVRGAATDLNLTIGLALVTSFAIQVLGVASQGPVYFQKLINVGRRLEMLAKNPLRVK